jgi:N utilization substance protein A
MFDLKAIHTVLDQLEQERNIPKAKIIDAIASSLATAYKKEHGRRSQIIKADFDVNTGKVEFFQAKIVVGPSDILTDEEIAQMKEDRDNGIELTLDQQEAIAQKIRFNEDQHIMLEDAQKIKRDVAAGDELVFPLEYKGDFGRIAAQTAKQVIMQKIREAEKVNLLGEFGSKEGEIVVGTVQFLLM